LLGPPSESLQGCARWSGQRRQPRFAQAPFRTASRIDGLAERTAEFIYGRLQAYPEGGSWREHWREITEIIQKTRQRKPECRHLLRQVLYLTSCAYPDTGLVQQRTHA
jgi:hypothetical protein